MGTRVWVTTRDQPSNLEQILPQHNGFGVYGLGHGNSVWGTTFNAPSNLEQILPNYDGEYTFKFETSASVGKTSGLLPNYDWIGVLNSSL